MPTRIKICGITRIEDALAATRLGADAIGFIFWRKSARFISPAKAREIVDRLPPFVSSVGVYVDPEESWVEESSTIARLSLLQFHGDESPEFCDRFSLPYIKAIRVRDGVDLLQYEAWYSSARGLLLDTYTEGMPGGTGDTFNWDLIPQGMTVPLILSGGLHPGNVSMAIKRVHPWAVDVSSGVESDKGIKDAEKIAAFMRGVRHSESL
jgi:phosphoribosylanthranilate isomerase